MHQRIGGISCKRDPINLNQIKKLTQTSIIIVVLSSTVTISVFADRLHVINLASAAMAGG